MGFGFMTRFAKYAWAVLAYNLLVVMWGAYVRASGSGAGCGSHWPTCGGEVIPRAPEIATIIEFAHRLTSGLALISVVVLFILALKAYDKRSRVWIGSLLAVILMLFEALIGAGLVLFELVAENKSVARALFMSVHLVNTFFLLAIIALTSWWASGGPGIQLRKQGALSFAVFLGLSGLLVLGVSGAVTALGDTLFPAKSLAEGLTQDFSQTAHFLLRLRVIHPFLALGVGLYSIALAVFASVSRQSAWTKRWAFALVCLVVVQLSIGLINLVLLAPIPLQLIHLLLADLMWLALVLMSASALGQPKEVLEKLPPQPNFNPQFSSSR